MVRAAVVAEELAETAAVRRLRRGGVDGHAVRYLLSPSPVHPMQLALRLLDYRISRAPLLTSAAAGADRSLRRRDFPALPVAAAHGWGELRVGSAAYAMPASCFAVLWATRAPLPAGPPSFVPPTSPRPENRHGAARSWGEAALRRSHDTTTSVS